MTQTKYEVSFRNAAGWWILIPLDRGASWFAGFLASMLSEAKNLPSIIYHHLFTAGSAGQLNALKSLLCSLTSTIPEPFCCSVAGRIILLKQATSIKETSMILGYPVTSSPAALPLLVDYNTNHRRPAKPNKEYSFENCLAITVWPLSKLLRSLHLTVFPASNTLTSKTKCSIAA